jgi:hypothetical protein
MRVPRLLAVPLVFTLAGCFMPAATANRLDNRFRDARLHEVREKLRILTEHTRGQGWSVVGAPHVGWIEETYNEADEPRFTIPATGRYALIAICDGNCSDIDLVVLDGGRRRLGADLEPDDRPAVEFSASRGDVVRGRVTIPGCRIRTCAYGVMLVGN